MKVVETVFKKISYKNNLPENLKPADKWLFDTHVHTHINEVKIYKGSNVVIWPEHILIANGKIWREELTNHYIGSRKYEWKRRVKNFLRKKVQLNGKYALITDDWSWSYFHWTGDAYQRAFLLRKFFPEYTILVPEHFSKLTYVMQGLEMMGARIAFIPTNKKLVVKELLTASPVGSSGLFRYDFVQDLANYMRQHPMVANARASSPEKIYISRGKARYRKIINEQDVIDVVEKNGFTVLYPEQADFVDQVKYFQNCKYLISLHGAGLTNALYLPPNAKVFEIRHPKDNLNNCYYLLATALLHKYYYFLATTESNDTHSSDFFIDIDNFRKEVQSFLKGDNIEKPLSLVREA